MTVGSMMGERLKLNGSILRKIREIKSDIEALAARHGMPVEDLCRIPSADVNALDVSPDGQTWSGKGRKPSWLKKAEAEGLEMAQFKVSGDLVDDQDSDQPQEAG